MSSNRTILGILHDPGATAMLIPVLKALAADPRVRLQLYASRFAGTKLGEEGILFDSFSDEVSLSTLIAWFDHCAAGLLLTGTSWGSAVEQTARNLAHERGLRSVTVVDYWSGYLERWTGCNHALGALTDEILVVNEAMKGEMQAVGFPEKQLSVAGHPNLERIIGASVRKAGPLSVSKVLFLSEPLRTTAGAQNASTVQSKIAEFFQNLAVREGISAQIDLKLHPKELAHPVEWDLTRFDRLAVKSAAPGLIFPGAFAQYDLIAGYQTMGLLEAAASGARAVAIPALPLTPPVLEAFDDLGICILDARDSSGNWEDRAHRHFELIASATAPNKTYRGSTDRIIRKIIA